MKTAIIFLILILLSGCIGEEKEKTYSHAVSKNHTENFTLYPDGKWMGVFYGGGYDPKIELSGVYRITEKEIIMTTPTGKTFTFKKEGTNFTYEGRTWILNK